MPEGTPGSITELEARLNTRPLRLKAVWLLVVPFLWFAAPDPGSMLTGASLGTMGLLIRAWAAGTIQKEEELATTGPYAYTRNPLYIGSLFVGVGVTFAGGGWLWVGIFLAFYLTVYARTMVGERELLTELFGDDYEHYAANVPAFVPRLTPYSRPSVSSSHGDGLEKDAGGSGSATGGPGNGFAVGRYLRNKEWEAAVGFMLAFGYFVARWWLGGGGAA